MLYKVQISQVMTTDRAAPSAVFTRISRPDDNLLCILTSFRLVDFCTKITENHEINLELCVTKCCITPSILPGGEL